MRLALLLVIPLLLGAHPAVETLRGGPLPPEVRDAAISDLVEADLTPEDLVPLFTPGQHRSGTLSGARVVRRRLAGGDRALAPLAWRAFLDSKHNTLPHDPDVFERLLLGLQEAGPDVLPLLPGAESPDVADAAWRSLHGDLLQRLGSQVDWEQPDVAVAARAWTQGLLAKPQPLIRLQTDSGDAAFRLHESLQADQLAALIRTLPDHQVDFAVEAWSLRFQDWPNPNEAVRARGFDDRVIDPPPTGPADADRLRPRAPIPAFTLADDHRLDAGSRTLSPAWLLLLLPLAWVGALRAFPHRRTGLFRVGAAGVGLGAIGLLELGLTAAGVEPLLTARPQVYSYRGEAAPEPGEAFGAVGANHATLLDGDARHTVFATQPRGPRVIVFGESSAHGSNHLAEETFAAHLGSALGVEVINAGIGGAISDEIAPTAVESLDYAPDVFVLYFGFNDLARLPTLVELKAFSPTKLRLRELLDRSRVVRVLADVLPSDWLEIPPSQRLRAPAGQVDPDALRAVQSLARNHAARNMRRIIEAAASRGVRCVVAVQALNEDTCATTGEFAPDPAGCVAQNLRGVALDAAAGTDALVVDVPAALREHAGGPAGHAYFWDGIHPSRLGHAVIGEALAPAVREALDR